MATKDKIVEIFYSTLTPCILVDSENANFKITAVNKSLEILLCKSQNKLVGMEVMDCLEFFSSGPDDETLMEWDRALKQVQLKKQCLEVSVRRNLSPAVVTRDIRKKMWKIMITPIIDKRKNLTSILVSIVDESVHIKPKEDDSAVFYNLTYQYNIYKGIFENHPNLLFKANEEGFLTAANKNFLDFFRFDSTEINKIHLRDLLEEDDLPMATNFIHRCMKGELVNFQCGVKSRQIGKFYCGITLMPLKINEKIDGLYGILVDKSENQKNKRKELQNSIFTNTITNAINILVGPDEKEVLLKKVFSMIGNAISIDRIHLYTIQANYSDGNTFAFPVCSWSKSGDGNEEFLGLSMEEIQPCINFLEKNLIYKVKYNELPKGAYKEFWASKNLMSAISFPLFFDNKFIGFFFFEVCTEEKSWSYDEINFLKTLVFNLSLVLEKLHLQELQKK